MKNPVKYSSQLEAAVLKEIKELAKSQGRKLQDVINEAVKEYLERARSSSPRPHVMKAFHNSLSIYDSVYKKLAN
ncbi:MAG: hypothetical protein COZ46_03110 [Verrucomicrobia bacterium CG_4_10_14_3_um_filter_43_23]|nr:MAG: hypothetical protein AUJ82_00535 [Verrucomicrobia bacterium CG1_02_43_26]PIP59241.1 MAG: hypothetical protein COX01_04400 [Verrucomicrobia bacterium CG22_combo_CG10-13_8_21_14_all_43_17]PIX58575.1 MAG: hypothetical protein COZ46_03110 [Verrucomicrobia bacterium CG_4_10_14_3_um_filter_43_23]PIY61027.1 MAG: hypothetical protein COY94_07430 [Verrucomicrobia bacterium CG_4_10_14_0_8_um_filter_43_34]PJA43868.1 MAG: hypothetical protein CO175_05800 [Verrucomicrobia bacterium CG_4_9_14_3_um_fi